MLEQLQGDLSLAFQDWGESVEYHVVSRVLNLETQQVTETVEVTTLKGLLGSTQENRLKATGGLAVSSLRELLVRASDLPEDAPQLTDRVMIGTDEYQIQSFHQEPRGDLIMLQIVRV